MNKLVVMVPHTLSKKVIKDCISTATFFQGKETTFTIMFSADGNGLTKRNLHCQPQKWSFMEEKLSSVHDENTGVSFILSF